MTMNTSFSNELQQLQMELRAQNFDIIRFSTYRIACKLRFIQKKLNFHLLDLLNVIESLRECLTSLSVPSSSNNKHSVYFDSSTYSQSHLSNTSQCLSINHLTSFLTSIYTNLNKRLPLSRQIAHTDKCVQSAIAWLLYVYKSDTLSIRFNSFRVLLTLLCTGKLIDKIHHLFVCSLSTSSSNALTYAQINELLHEILALPYALQEIPLSTLSRNYAQLIFAKSSSPINFDSVLDLLLYNNNTPICLQWLVLFHRLISVENVIHRVKCSACQRPSFSGFRYKCLQCTKRTYQLCQDCFWRGRTSDQHLSTHEMKEYTYFTLPNKHCRYSLRKSLQCIPKNEKPCQYFNSLTVDKEQKLSQENLTTKNKEQLIKNDENKSKKIDIDEHNEIASYTKQLTLNADKQKFNPTGIQSERKISSHQHQSRRAIANHQSQEKKVLISKLDAENRRIMHEINKLRVKLKHQSLTNMGTNDYRAYSDTNLSTPFERNCSQTLPNPRSSVHHKFTSMPSNRTDQMRRAGSAEAANKNSYFEHELRILLTRKNQLESRIHELQLNREELASQLDHLYRTPSYSPDLQQRPTIFRSSNCLNNSPSRMNTRTLKSKKTGLRSYSTPSTPVHNQLISHLHTDLLLAADSLTSAMSSLVQQLNTEDVESFRTVSQTKNKFTSYPCDCDNRTDDELFLVSDDDYY
ncbi:unnamed protein product [Rotaria magnacalcarata]|uniref:ZZ-type domain-containing protein n=3 Tax=Rotaria magnacalcarata TaxID=392030 RepID=A0A816P495_9BILA|nr:unnamed protein product [Rotaria magnacalcarata]